jgi:hypothetical protein
MHHCGCRPSLQNRGTQIAIPKIATPKVAIPLKNTMEGSAANLSATRGINLRTSIPPLVAD